MIYIKFIDKDYFLKNNNISFFQKAITNIFYFILPNANLDYDRVVGNVYYWFLEFEDILSCPIREIGLDINLNIIVKTPDKRNNGYWTDLEIKLDYFLEKFQCNKVKQEEFENLWKVIP